MDFNWTAAQIKLRERAVEFAREKLSTEVIARDRESHFSKEIWEECARFGLQGCVFPENFGGMGLDLLSGMLLMEGMGYGSRDSGILFSINAQIWGCAHPILNFGTESQKEKYLPGLSRGKLIGALGMTEPEAGSDAFSIKARAEKSGDFYVLNGTKTFITNGPVADIALVYARTSGNDEKAGISCFIVEKSDKGFRSGKKIEKMGLRTSPFSELILEDCRLPINRLLGKEEDGKFIFINSMVEERIFIMAAQIGVMERQLEECVQYSKKRKQFGKDILEFQAISSQIAEMKIRLERSRLLLYWAAWEKTSGANAILSSSAAKLNVSEDAVKNSLSAMRIFGGYSYTTEFEVERQLRDSIGGLFYSGTSEIQKNIISQMTM